MATHRRHTPLQFYTQCIERLPQKFYAQHHRTMEHNALERATQGLYNLRQSARDATASCETIKNAFLGGMKEGESWGLRKWLSQYGNGLQVCTDVECIVRALQQQLDRQADSTHKLAQHLRPLATQTLQRLRTDIPDSYQARSAAHPYLPFFHRIEAALQGIVNFDPTQDDVICIDDSDDETPNKKQKTEDERKIPSKRFSRVLHIEDQIPQKRAEEEDESSSGESDNNGVIEVVGVANREDNINALFDWSCTHCQQVNSIANIYCPACGEENTDKDQVFFSTFGDFVDVKTGLLAAESKSPPQTMPLAMDDTQKIVVSAMAMSNNLNRLADIFDQNQQASIRPVRLPPGSFWEADRYAEALRLFASLLREGLSFVERVDEDQLIRTGNPPYSHVVRHPLCFRDICAALLQNEEEPFSTAAPHCSGGSLPVRTLSSWNMWNGVELLQAIDLVLLNSLAYGKVVEEGKSSQRSQTNKLRKVLWKGIQDIVARHLGADLERRKQCTPTRRSESSGFVVYKIQRETK